MNKDQGSWSDYTRRALERTLTTTRDYVRTRVAPAGGKRLDRPIVLPQRVQGPVLVHHDGSLRFRLSTRLVFWQPDKSALPGIPFDRRLRLDSLSSIVRRGIRIDTLLPHCKFLYLP
jgi:hypothetical protein